MIRKVNNIYTIGVGYYMGEKMLLTWINPYKNICVNGKRYTSVYGKLLNSNKKIQTILEFLRDRNFIDYKRLSKIQLILKIKSGDIKAKKEFIVRFKKIPKF